MRWPNELEFLLHAIRVAGKEAVRLAEAGFETTQKADRSPVTSADLAVNQILHAHLQSAFPADGWLSEESPDDPGRLQKARVWVVDPIDGTKAFINREPEFCISVALVEGGRPIVAAIFNPSADELYTATRGGGLYLNAAPITPPSLKDKQPPIVAMSPWERDNGRFPCLDGMVTSRPMRSIAWGLALTASGHIHGLVTLEPENEWDVAAGALLIEESGGQIYDGGGRPLAFNQTTPRYQGTIAASPTCPDVLRQKLALLTRVGEKTDG
ncbi:MAG: 3'(2'),5'-bisphosphate nucleotidase CysQ [Nitrospira sp. WS110]|nr:3'(2'),5'-bisphosphate nucleotidase CysQ [Nitrospira sp. WS110]